MLHLEGKVFNRLTVIRRAEKNGCGSYKWECKCECGKTVLVDGPFLKSGHTQSCGCFQKDQLSKAKKIHGMAKSAESYAWQDAKRRCFKKTNEHYPLYGGRGITMCRRWKASFKAFLDDLGKKSHPSLSIDRIDNDGHYSCGECPECLKNGWPMNVRWASKKEQANNRRKKSV